MPFAKPTLLSPEGEPCSRAWPKLGARPKGWPPRCLITNQTIESNARRNTWPRKGSKRVAREGGAFFALAISLTMQRSAGKPAVARVALPGAKTMPHVVLCFMLAHKGLWCCVRRRSMVGGSVLRMIEVEGARVERRRSAVVEIRKHLAGLYWGFVWWASLYGEVDDDY
jgi:hypothetical protein